MKVKKTATDFLKLAINYYEQGNFVAALEICDKLEQNGFVDANLLNIRSLTLIKLEKPDSARKNAVKANEITEYKNPYFLNTLGITLKNLEKYEEAIQILESAIAIDKNAENLNNLANCYYEQEKFNEAAKFYQEAINLNSVIPQPYENLSSIFLRRKMDDLADHVLNIAKEKNVISDVIYRQRIKTFLKLDQPDEAERELDSFFKISGESTEYINSKIKILVVQEKKSELWDYLNSINLTDQPASIIGNFVFGLQSLNKFEEIRNIVQDLEKRQWPGFNAESKAVVLWNHSQTLLRHGEVKDAWAGYLQRMEMRDFPSERRKFKKPLLNKLYKAKNKKIMVWREQGLGDEILFLTLMKSFMDLSLAKDVIIECNQKLVDVLATSFPDLTIRAAEYDIDTLYSDVEDYDYHIPMGNLPELLKLNEKNIGLCKPYINLGNNLRCVGDHIDERKPLVGLAWRSGNLEKSRLQYYTSLEEWAPLINKNDIQTVCLQYGDIAADLENIDEQTKSSLLIPEFNLKDDLVSLTSLMAKCTYIISPGISVAAHAGAMGKTVFSYTTQGGPLMFGRDKQRKKRDYYLHPWYSDVRIFTIEDFAEGDLVRTIISNLLI